MSKKKRISASEKEFNRLRKNANAKVKRIYENFGGQKSMEMFEHLQENVKPFHEMTTKERNKAKEFMSEFTRRGNLEYQFEKNKNNLVESKAFLRNLEKNTEIAQKLTIKNFVEKGVARAEELKGMSFEEQKEFLKNRKLAGLQIPSEFEFDAFTRKGMLNERAQRMAERSNQEFYDAFSSSLKENHIQQMLNIYNSDAESYVSKIRRMSDSDFYGFYQSTDGDVFDVPYKADGSDDYMALLEDVENELDSYLADENITLLNEASRKWD